MIKVKDERGLVRDPSSKAILVTDNGALSEHRRKKNLFKKLHSDTSRVSVLEETITKQHHEIEELKLLVKKLLETK